MRASLARSTLQPLPPLSHVAYPHAYGSSLRWVSRRFSSFVESIIQCRSRLTRVVRWSRRSLPGGHRRGSEELPIVEGTSRTHRHVTAPPNKHPDANDSGDVTKIELELEEAPDEPIFVGSMPNELDATVETNSTYLEGIPESGAVVVRAEEALIVVLVLLLWVAAIALFFNRWGKIRMLEPYQPKFQQQHRPSCPTEPSQLQHRTYSKFNIHWLDQHSVHQSNCASGVSRPRQNSVFVGSSGCLLPTLQDSARRTRSAFDLQSLSLTESRQERDAGRSKLIQSDRLSQERTFSEMRQERELYKPKLGPTEKFQRDRGMSIWHFDRMDVIARPLQRDRGMSISQFDRMDVLARPTPIRPFRDRRVSACNALEERRMSGASLEAQRQEMFPRCQLRTAGSHDRPSCSKTADVVLGYKATCV